MNSDEYRLELSQVKFYGRTQELSTLEAAFTRAEVKDSNEFVVVRGYSGTGKSELVDAFRACSLQITSDNEDEGDDDDNDNDHGHSGEERAFYCRGKCDDSRVMEPFAALKDAIGELCGHLQASKDRATVAYDIMEATGEDGAIFLTSVVPGLSALTDLHALPNNVEDSSTTTSKLLNLFRLMVRALTKLKPLVLFIDDLQWVDASTLQVLSSLATDPQLKKFMLIVSYRDNGVTPDHPCAKELDTIREKGKDIVDIKVVNLAVEDLNSFLAGVLRRECNEVEPLSRVIHEKTYGNIFFTLQFLQMLEMKQMLTFSFANLRWEWVNPSKIRNEMAIADNVVDLVAHKIKQLPDDAQSCLRIASCLSSFVEVNILTKLIDGLRPATGSEPVDVGASLARCQQEGLMIMAGKDGYKFAHDRIRQASYSLIPPGPDRDKLHERIGRLILQMRHESTQVSQSDWMVFVAADQLHKGRSCIDTEEGKVELAKMNLSAGQKAMALAAFTSASQYLSHGIDALESTDDPWEKHRELHLALHQNLADASWSDNGAANIEQLIEKIIRHACTDVERFSAYLTLGHALGTAGREAEAAALEAEQLTKMGVFPRYFRPMQALLRLKRLKKRLEGVTLEQVMELPECKDPSAIIAMKLTLLLSKHATMTSNDTYQLLSMMETVNLMLDNGFHRSSIAAFAQFGILVSHFFGDAREGHRLGELSLALANRLGVIDTFTIVTSKVNSWYMPITETLEPMLEGFSAGMKQGQIEISCICFQYYILHRFVAGLSLQTLLEDAAVQTELLQDYGLAVVTRMLQIIRQAAMNLAGKSESVTVLTGDAMDEDEVMDSDKNIASLYVYMFKAMISTYFGELELADECLQNTKKLRKTAVAFAEAATLLTYDAVIPLALATETGSGKHKRRARAATKKIKGAIAKENKGINLAHRVLIIEADFDALNSKKSVKEVLQAYDLAIRTSSRSGFRQDAAVANQHAGEFCLKVGDNCRAKDYLARAVDLFIDWGAFAVAHHLRSKYQGYIDGVSETASKSTNYYGRKRHQGRRFSEPPLDVVNNAATFSQRTAFSADV